MTPYEYIDILLTEYLAEIAVPLPGFQTIILVGRTWNYGRPCTKELINEVNGNSIGSNQNYLTKR